MMTISIKSFSATALAILLGHSTASPAIEPESGIYWAEGRPGEGLLIERQGDQIGLVLYTYSASGEPEFYVAGGPLEEGGFSEPVGWTEGFFPLHRVRATLFRTSDGPRFNSVDLFFTDNGREFVSTPVGIIDATFQYGDYVNVTIRLDEIPQDGHPTQRQITTFGYSRSNFGFQGFGINTFSNIYPNPFPCWNDLAGVWTFVDTTSTTGDVWRFDFLLDEIAPASDEMTCPPQVGESQVLVYVDANRETTMRCVSAPSGDPRDGRKHIPGCEVTRNESGEALFYFHQEDIGLKRMVGSRGQFPDNDSGVLRTPERIIGVRID